jgi:hypothetical protein
LSIKLGEVHSGYQGIKRGEGRFLQTIMVSPDFLDFLAP